MLTLYFSGMTMISNNGVLMSILDTIEHFGELDIEFGNRGCHSFIYLLEVSGGLDLLEELQKVPNREVYERIINIFNKYLELDEGPGAEVA